MKDFEKFDPDRVDFSDSEQNRVISELVFNTEFLQRCIRKGLEPDLFTSELRQIVASYTFEYFRKYKEAPDESILDILSGSSNGMRTVAREEDLEDLELLLGQIVNTTNSPGVVKRMFDKISAFIDKRIIHTTITRLNKAKDRIDGSPESLKKIVEDASRRLGITSCENSTLGIFDETDFSQEPWLTRFNIREIDNAYGGGFSSPNLVIIQAFTGRGKTWSICHLGKVGLRLGNDVIALVTEMNAKKFLTRMRQTLTGMSLMEQRENINLARQRIEKSLVRGSLFHLVSDQVKMDSDFRIDRLRDIVDDIQERRGKEQKIILIDSPDDMEPPADVTYNPHKAIEKSKAIYTWLRNYSQEEDKLIVVTSQSQRVAETRLWTTSGNIGDDINKARRATLGISINGYKNEVEAGFVRLLVFKNTYGPDMKAAWVETDFDRGMFEKASGAIKGMNIEEYKKMLVTRGISLSNTKSVG